MRITKLLASTSFLTVNKHLINLFGLESAVVLADLISKEEYFFNRESLKDGYFFNTNNDINNSTSLSYYQIQKGINILVAEGIIEKKLKGIPAKTYYKINHENIFTLFKSKFSNIQKLEFKNSKTINNNKVNNKDNTKVLSNRFKKPNIDELKEYFKEKGDISQSEIFYDYYESKGWLVGKANMKCWKSAVRNWLRRSEQKTASSEFPDYYDKKLEWSIGNDSSKLSRYHKHLRNLGWTCVHSPTAGTIWKK
tara:strand:+ start:4514 stop:5269 length:756 start_codon:yes stop_codon:yes gene_type:complete